MEWDRKEKFVVSVSSLVREVSSSDWFLAATARPLAANIVFDFDHHRFVLAGGPALDLYRRVQEHFVEYVCAAN